MPGCCSCELCKIVKRVAGPPFQASHVHRLVEYDRRTGRLLNLKTFISDTFSSQPSGAPTWRFGYDHVACTHRIRCKRIADGCSIGLRMLVDVEGTVTPLGFKVVGYLYSSQPSSKKLPMVLVLLVSLWRRWSISQPAYWMVARIESWNCENWSDCRSF